MRSRSSIGTAERCNVETSVKTDVNPWDQRYGSDTYYYGPEPNAFLHEHLAAIRRGGEGRNAVFLAEQGYAVVAVDQSQAGLKKTERLAALDHRRNRWDQSGGEDIRTDYERWVTTRWLLSRPTIHSKPAWRA